MLDKKDPCLKTNISNFGIRENLKVEVCLGILDEHVQHLFQHVNRFHWILYLGRSAA